MAEIEYPVGEDSRLTEREMLAGDLVWVTFIAGDSRYPLITGYRNPRVGNVSGIRRLHQQTVKVLADGTLHLQGASITIEGGSVNLNGTTKINGIVQVGN